MMKIIALIGISGSLCAVLDINYEVHSAILWGIGTLVGFFTGLVVANEE